MTDRRRDIATAATGGTLLAGGGAMRHAGVSAAYPKIKPRVHALGMLKAPKGKRLYWAGSALGLVGLPPLAVGTSHAIRGDVDKADPAKAAQAAHQLSIRFAEKGKLDEMRRALAVRNTAASRRVTKADDRPGFWREGISGSKDALKQRADSVRQPVPTKLRALQAGIGAGTGALGSLAARAALGRRGDALKPVLTPIAGGLAATGSVPLTNKAIKHRYPAYEVTPAGVRRRKTDRKLPSTRASRYQPTTRSFRQDVGKAYLGQGSWSPTKAMLGGLHGVRTSKVRQLGNRMATDKYFGNLRAYNRASQTAHPVGFRQVDPKQVYQVHKAATDERYMGARTPYYRQRAAITAAGHPPVIGPFTASAAAARYAPPGQRRKQAARQYALGSAAGLPVGVAGAYGGAKLANRSESFHRSASKIVDTKAKIEGKARRAVGLKQVKGGPVARATGKFLESKHGEPFRTPRGKVGGAAGFLAGKMVTGGVLGQTAISLNQRDQRRYNARHHIEKMDLSSRGQTKREKHTLAQRKRRSAVLSTVGGTLGLSSLGLLAAGKRQPAITAGTVGSGLGGVNALLGARVQRQEARNVDPVKKSDYSGFWAAHRAARKIAVPKPRIVHLRQESGRYACGAKHVPSMSLGMAMQPMGRGRGVYPIQTMLRNTESTSSSKYLHNVTCPTCKAGASAEQVSRSAEAERSRLKGVHEGNAEIAREKRTGQHRASQAVQRYINKAAPLAITGTDREHHDSIRRYGDRGPLPKGLSRDERMKAYEARYVHHGGDKQNKWQRRATLGNSAKNVGLGIATGGTAAWLASRGRRSGAMLAKHPRLRHHAETVTGTGAVIGGVGEMYSGYAHRKQSSYANSPGGVAASALRRMRENTPEGQTS